MTAILHIWKYVPEKGLFYYLSFQLGRWRASLARFDNNGAVCFSIVEVDSKILCWWKIRSSGKSPLALAIAGYKSST